ncbi:hypothetical protein BDV93DRAFT_520390 [Ceratobasidium sp. AG-I]|nr:hypothetical protein BDV93DRAFT_520390 [Ceratobasidium sp. AG-I]
MSSTQAAPREPGVVRRFAGDTFVPTGSNLNSRARNRTAPPGSYRTTPAPPASKRIRTKPKMKPNYASSPSSKHTIPAILSAVSTPTQVPLVLYYPSKSEYEPVHESIPIYYGFLAEAAPRVYYEEPARDDIEKAKVTLAPQNNAEPEQLVLRAKCVYPKDKNTPADQYKCLNCRLPFTPWQRYIRCSGYPSDMT